MCGASWLTVKGSGVRRTLEDASQRLDDSRFSDRVREEEYDPRGDDRLVRVFPYFVAVVLVLWAIGTVYVGDYSVPKLIELLCLSFTLCFAILGVPCALNISKGMFSGWFDLMFALAVTIVLWSISNLHGDHYFGQAVEDILGVVGIYFPGLWGEVFGFLCTYAVMLFTSIGVLSVISAYLRRYMPEVFSGMNRHARAGTRGRAERFFKVPDIIDVEEVVLEPPSVHVFDVRKFFSIFAYLFVLGMMISSYVFVNPYFLDVMGWKTMLAITLMLSMFTPALILPWQIVQSVGAEVRSSAPRNYQLWEGARSRLFTTFATLGAFMMMFLISVYLGNDILAILSNYVGFLIPLMCTAAMYAFLYVNNFENTDREVICTRFEDGRGLRRQLLSRKGGKRPDYGGLASPANQ